jgi:HAD superfamily hydrolase (TIGR01509 family)
LAGMRSIRAVIFDMDGVIADSEPIHILAEKELFLPYDVLLSDEELHGFMGTGIESMLKKLVDAYAVQVNPIKLYEKHKANLLKRMQNGLLPIPGSLELIRRLADFGILLGLATSSFRDMVRLVLQKFGIENCFHAVVTVDDISRSKPDPEIFLATADRLGVSPHGCLVVEDSTNGVLAAKAAGMTCIGFVSPNSRNQNLESADVIVDSMEAIKPELLLSLGLTVQGIRG